MHFPNGSAATCQNTLACSPSKSANCKMTASVGPWIGCTDLNKRGLLSFVFDGRYKFARYYAPNAFNAPKTLEQIFKYNDVQLFDLKDDPDEVRNLALDREKSGETILRLNALLNDLMAKEVGVNHGKFLPEVVRPKKPPLTFEEP
jgi:hypothetical protein